MIAYEVFNEEKLFSFFNPFRTRRNSSKRSAHKTTNNQAVQKESKLLNQACKF